MLPLVAAIVVTRDSLIFSAEPLKVKSGNIFHIQTAPYISIIANESDSGPSNQLVTFCSCCNAVCKGSSPGDWWRFSHVLEVPRNLLESMLVQKSREKRKL
ncbi:hypothetical protein TNIN_484031 [Trichonephila inaurata madagascariensis]|uniref:Uncharacterized protein n=1 Tax=Trichonephila inaurata madagascariensis TaxID=2747483 RepID=A0A8X6YFH9_9ARAC|nr:hypothetical protein TNIN_484031 [Trichonephila inaurata madagascariensis]